MFFLPDNPCSFLFASRQNHDMASIIKRGDKWIAQVFKLGVRKAASFPTKGKAQAWATQIEAEIIAGKKQTSTDKTLRDALLKYGEEVSKTKRGARWELIRINAWQSLPFVDYKLADVATPRLAEWRDERLKTVKTSTVNRELNLLASIFEQARREWQWIDVNPIRDVRRPPQPKHRERLFTNEEISIITSQLGFESYDEIHTKSQIIAMALLFALETAMRREEITSLEWDRIDMKRKFLSLPKTKNGDARQVPLSKKAIEILTSLQKFDRPFDVDKDVLSTLFRKACIRAGIENGRFHDARATALTRLSSKLNVLELARLAGHRDIKSLQIYYRETAESLATKLD
jgi:integrase